MTRGAIREFVAATALGVALFAGGNVAQGTAARIAATPTMLNLRASYNLAVGDVDRALVLLQEASQARQRCSGVAPSRT